MDSLKPAKAYQTLVQGGTDEMVMWERMCVALLGKPPTEEERAYARAKFAAEDAPVSEPVVPSEAPSPTGVRLPEPFDGYPYLVTRIGHSALRHIAVLPADWPRGRLVDLARRQAEANRLDTALCLGPGEAVFFAAEGGAVEAAIIPTGIAVAERLALSEPVPETEEVAVRRGHLQAYAKRSNPGGYLVGDGLEGGRPATPEDIDRLSRPNARAAPKGLSRCTTCRLFTGDYLALHGEGNGDHTPRVIRVHCRCQNHNRCAGCGEPLADWRLSAYLYDEAAGSVKYAAAYMAFNHRCP